MSDEHDVAREEEQQQQQAPTQEQAQRPSFPAYLKSAAERFCAELVQLLDSLSLEQQALLLELGYSREERYALSVRLAEHLYGVVEHEEWACPLAEVIPSEGWLQAFCFTYLTAGGHARELGETYARQLLKSQTFLARVREDYEEQYGSISEFDLRGVPKPPVLVDETILWTDDQVARFMSLVWGDDRADGSTRPAGRARRSGGRTRWGHPRAVPEP